MASFGIMLPYPISGNRANRIYKGRAVKSKAVIAFNKEVAIAAHLQIKEPLKGDVYVVYTLHPKMNKDGSANKKLIDRDNAEKTVNDALNGIAWVDDKQIQKHYTEVGEPIKGGGILLQITDDLEYFRYLVERTLYT